MILESSLAIRSYLKNTRPNFKGQIGGSYGRGGSFILQFRGYWNNDQATSEDFLDHEWATVGDLARQDGEGYYYIVDRAKDMIITGGVNVYPVEIEEVLHTMDKILDVAVIVGGFCGCHTQIADREDIEKGVKKEILERGFDTGFLAFRSGTSVHIYGAPYPENLGPLLSESSPKWSSTNCLKRKAAGDKYRPSINPIPSTRWHFGWRTRI